MQYYGFFISHDKVSGLFHKLHIQLALHELWAMLGLVGTSFINTGDIYYFGTGLPISMSKNVYQYHHFK